MTDIPERENNSEIGRQTIHLPGDMGAKAVRLEVTRRHNGQWVTEQYETELRDGVGRLEIVLLGPEPGEGTVAEGSVADLAAAVAFDLTRVQPAERALGMDVSYAQGFTVNFERAAAGGVRFCFIRAASGKNEKDENFEHNYAQAGRVGMLRGIYYYLYGPSEASIGDEAARSPEGQARRFVSLLKPDAELGAVVDIEDTSLTAEHVRRFVDEFQRLDPYGRPITIYTAAWFWNAARGFGGPAVSWAARHPLWVAHYTHAEEPIKPSPQFQVAIPEPWSSYAVHQWTSRGGSLAGHSSVDLDLNYFQGSIEQLRQWARGDVIVEDGEPDREGEPAVIATKYVTPEIGLRLRAGPSTDAEILTNMPWGKEVQVLKEGEWDQLRVDGQIGYASSQFLSTENPAAGAAPSGAFSFAIWPTNSKRVNQHFGEDPERYKEISGGFLPAHEGIDLGAPFGTPYYCVAPGTVVRVSDRGHDGKASAYGWHVVVDHGNGYSTLYAHAGPDIAVSVGQQVAPGQILAHSGNTGESSGPHLHLTLKKEGFTIPGWPSGYMNPWPFLEPLFNDLRPPMGNLLQGYLYARSLDMRGENMALAMLNLNLRQRPDGESTILAVVPQGSTVRRLNNTLENGYYLCEVSFQEDAQPKKVREADRPATFDLLHYVKGDGRQYEVKNAQGGQERFQTQEEGLTFYQVKNSQWEQFFYDNDFVYRDVDTSPGGGRYYRLRDHDRGRGSRWLRRRMALGEVYLQARQVQFYKKADGSPSQANSGVVRDTIRVAARHQRHRFRTGIELDDVLEVHWVNGPNDHTPKEKYFYARDFGLVGWERAHQDPNSPAWSAISEIHEPGAREPFVREHVVIV